MVPINRKRVNRKSIGPGAKKRVRRGPSPGTLHRRHTVSAENVAFVGGCLLPHYKKAGGWSFLKPEERGTVKAIAKALVDRHIVTGTMPPVVKYALIELDFQGVIDLPPPGVRRRRKQ